MSIWYLVVPAVAIGANAIFGKKSEAPSVDVLAAKAIPIAKQQVDAGVPMAQAVDYAAKAVKVGTAAKIPLPTLPLPPLPSMTDQTGTTSVPMSKAQAYANAVKVQMMMERGIQNEPLPVVPQYALLESDLPRPSPNWQWKRMTFEGIGPNSGKFWVYSSTSNWGALFKDIVAASAMK